MQSIKSQRIPNSEIRLMLEAAGRMEKEGREVIHLEIGRPDFRGSGTDHAKCLNAHWIILGNGPGNLVSRDFRPCFLILRF